MPLNREEIIDEIKRNIRKFGGEMAEWCVGTAKDARGPFFHSHLVAELGDGLIYREAFTADAARAIQDHLVHACGLVPDLTTIPDPGKIVFAYRKIAQAPPEIRSNTPAFRRRAA